MEKQSNLVHTFSDMHGRNLDLNPNHTFHFADSNNMRTQEHKWDCQVQINGTWTFNKNTKALQLTAKSWRGLIDKTQIQKEFFAKNFTEKKWETLNFDFVSSDINCFGVDWDMNKMKGMSIKILKNTSKQTNKIYQGKHHQEKHQTKNQDEKEKHPQHPNQHKTNKHSQNDTHEWHHEHGHHHDQFR